MAAGKFTDLIYQREDCAAVLTLNRPECLNALRLQTGRDLLEALAEAERDPDVRVIILQGAGHRAFSSGGDLKEMAKLSLYDREHTFMQIWGDVFRVIDGLRKPVIAAIRGYALGGGLELAMACHIRVAGTSARMGLAEVLRGHMPGMGGTVRLPRLIGESRGLYYLLTGEEISAVDAERFGLVVKVVDDEALTATVMQMARHIGGLAELSIRSLMEVVLQARDAPLAAALALEKALCARIRFDPDCREGYDAFLEKRAPRFGKSNKGDS